MTNLNKTYHKGKYRGGEWAKHLRPFLKRLGNKRFRNVAATLEEEELRNYSKTRKRKSRKRIKAKITIKLFGDSKYSYYKSYRSIKNLENAVKRPNVINYTILNQREDKLLD